LLFNVYGPTETTVLSACHRVDRADTTIPIGRPIAGTQIYAFDARMELVPIGVPGELYIGGSVIAGAGSREEILL
jgi:non-ribosomal peptide synthetase component F